MERYSEYKDSGVQWLGEIPEHWKIHRAKYMFNKEQRPILKDDEIVTCFRDGEVTLRKNRRISGFTEATDYSHYQHICKGDLVIHQMDAFAGSSGVSDSDGMGTPVLSVCTAKSGDINNFYYAHILRLMGRNGYILSLYRGIRERSSDFRFDTLAKQWLPLPSFSEQQSIVSYLDSKCEKIDKMIEGKEKQIALLQELKQRTIADAVTRGLNPDVKMKATNISWLEEIPEHWKIVKLKVFCKENKEKNKENIESCVLSLSYGKVIIKQNINFGLVPDNYENYQIVNPGYIILRLTDLQNDHRSLRTGLVKNRGIITSAYVGLILKDIDSEYTQLLLHTIDIIKVFYGMGGGLRQSMSYTNIANMYIPVPPISEQRAIVSYINERTEKIDTLTSKLQQEIESIKEYKQRLISDVVTGKIKVC